MTPRQFALETVQRLHEAGYQALWAGGCVRDELLGLTPVDYDIATGALPIQVRRLFHRTVNVGASFGVIEVLGPRVDGVPLKVQIATFRSDVSYSDGRHPDAVCFSSAREDALRRDFTVNGMFFDPLAGELIDYVGGRRDLESRLLRAIGDPVARFREDRLRLLRAVRIASAFELTIETATWSALVESAGQIRQISAERVAEELRKLLVHPLRSQAVRLLHASGLAASLLPELEEMKGLPQGPPDAPTGDLWDHVLAVLDQLGPSVSFSLALAALLHDVGKRRTVGRTPDRYTFYGHEDVGRRMAHDIGMRLKLSNAERERIEWLVKKHQYLSDAPRMRMSKLKVILKHKGIDDLLRLHEADARASGRPLDHVEYCRRLLGNLSAQDLDPEPLVNGHDLLAIGISRGPEYKRILDAVREAQLDGTLGTRPEALVLARELAKQRPDSQPPGGSSD